MTIENLLTLMLSGQGSLCDDSPPAPGAARALQAGLYRPPPPPLAAPRSRNDSGGSAASSRSSGCCSPPSAPGLPPHVLSLLAKHDLAARDLPPPAATAAAGGRQLVERSLSEPACQLQQAQNQQKVNPNRYKTEMCRPFEENGYCKYGNKCQFAHGSHEMRSVSRHPKYKTDLCRTYHTIGVCPYGPRCHFIHNEDERKLGQISQMKRDYTVQQVPVGGPQGSPQALGGPQLGPQQPVAAGLPACGDWAPPPAPPRAAATGRPQHLTWSMPLSLGSAASSITDSPIPSPTSSLEEAGPALLVPPPPGFTSPPATAPPTLGGAPSFPFPPSPAALTPNARLLDLVQGLQAASPLLAAQYDPDLAEAAKLLENISLSAGDDCSPAALRLPIFSRLSQDDL